MALKDKVIELRPVQYPEYLTAYENCVKNRWTHLELSIEPDIADWLDRLRPTDRMVIGKLFKAFTSAECVIGDHWKHTSQYIGAPEVIALLNEFTNQEVTHQYAYDFLEANIPMNDTVTLDWKEDPVAKKKLEAMISIGDDKSGYEKHLPTKMAAFSAFLEGVSLYASFAVLMSFTKKGLLKSMYQVLLWSAAEEANHSEWGIKLAKRLVSEGWNSIDADVCYETAEIVRNNEHDFLKAAFEGMPNLGNISLTEALSFTDHRANLKLMELGLKPIFPYSKDYRALAEYFYSALEGRNMTDFFALSRNGRGYSSVVEQDFTVCKF